MYSRQQYLSGECSHRQYYGQFVDRGVKRWVRDSIGLERIAASKTMPRGEDGSFNDIPLSAWDAAMTPLPRYIGDKMRAAGDHPTQAGLVCIAKEAARQLIE